MAAPRALTEVDQVNGALAEIGEPPVVSLDDKRAAARHAKRLFGPLRDELLRATSWQFAMNWCAPAAQAAAPPSGYTYRYTMPDDCIAVIAIEGHPNDAWETPSAGEDDTLAVVLDTEIASPQVQYTRRIVNPAQWDAQFATLFQLRLAAKLNPLIGRDKGLTGALLKRAEDMEDDASRRDAQARSGEYITRDTSWVQARRGVTTGWR
ncbi:MAG: hypothetical protein KGL46_14265 [Hyphomicrobiales bacterium]|nr:hypothetical protein [Hyphomicrobiales bacterium]